MASFHPWLSSLKEAPSSGSYLYYKYILPNYIKESMAAIIAMCGSNKGERACMRVGSHTILVTELF
jgi:hypothetical protein